MGQGSGPLLDEGVLVYAQRIGVEERTHGVYAAHTVLLFVLLYGIAGVLACPQATVVAHLAGDAVCLAYPVQGLALDLAVGSGHAATALGVVGGVYACDVALGILLYALGGVFVALDDVGVLQAHLLAGTKAHELLATVLHEVLALDVEFTREADDVCAGVLVLGVVDGLHLLHLSFGIVVDDEAHGVYHGANAQSTAVEVLAAGGLHQFDVVQRIEGGVTNLVNELQDGLGAVATAAYAADGGHAGVVPTVHHALLGEDEQVALGHEGVVQVQFVELELAGAVVLYVALVAFPFLNPGDEQVVEVAVRHELQCADGVCHALQIVALSVCEVVHGICVPLVAGAPVRHVQHAVHDGVAEVHVGTCHVYLGAQNHLARLHVARVHLAEKSEALLGRTVAVGTVLTRFGGSALLCRNLLGGLFVYVCLARQDAPFGKVPEVLEVVAGIAHLAPLVSEPLYVALYGTHIFHILLLWVGVVHAQVADTAELLCHAEVHGNGLGMAYVQVTVGFGWKACLQSSAVLALCQVLHYLFLDKVKALYGSLLCFDSSHYVVRIIYFGRQSYE